MNTFIITPEDGKPYEFKTPFTDPEHVFRSQAHWFTPSKRLTITNKETKEAATFSRVLDKAGNLIKVIKHN